MNKRLISILFAALSLINLSSGHAPFSRQAVVRSAMAVTEDSQTVKIRLADMGFTEAVVLNGPFQEAAVTFSLPPDWKITGETLVELQVQVGFQSLMEAFTSGDLTFRPVNQAGVLRIRLNEEPPVDTIIKESGPQTLNLTFSDGVLRENMVENTITFAWDTAGACASDITSYLAIDPESSIRITHEAKTSEIDLTDFPKPFFDNNLIQSYPTSIILINPDNMDDLSALMAVSAGLGKHSAGKLNFKVLTADEAQSMDLANDHLILIGQTEQVIQFPGMKETGLTEAIAAAGEKQSAGLIWLGLSPWNPGRTLLVVTGSDGPSIMKASAAIAGDHLVPYSEGNLAVISDLASSSGDKQFKIDYTLGDLLTGGTSLHVDRLGVTNLVIPFHVPGDIQVTSEAYLELYFRHSQLLNYLRSGLSVSINGRRIGTVRFSDNSAENGLTRILLPPDVILPQKNELELTYTLTGQDLCADERSGDYWVSVFDQSYLHLPPELSQETKEGGSTFNSIPASLMKGKGMSDLTFCGIGDNFENWRYAARLAFMLGSFTDEQTLTPAAVITQALDNGMVHGNLILIGLKDGLSAQAVVNCWLPLPLNAGTSLDNLTINGTQFNVAEGKDYGFIELGSNPKFRNRVLAILGSSPQGLQCAFNNIQEMIPLGNKPAANVRIVDSAGHIIEYQVEQAAIAGPAQTMQEKSWIDRLVSASANSRAGLLLVIFGLATTVFVTWAIIDTRKKRRMSK